MIYEKVIHCQYKLGPGVFGQARDLLNQIFVADPQYRVDLEQIQCHQVFKVSDIKILDKFVLVHRLGKS